MIHCFFEQSGTFKKEFQALGFPALNYDIRDDYGETDVRTDLFGEIEKAYKEIYPSIFDKIKKDDLIFAFFPCVRFEEQIQMQFRGTAFQQRSWSDEKKLEYDLKIHAELSFFYEIVTKLVIVCLRKKIKLIIENPYSANHYLIKYWAIRPAIIDSNRRERGDFFVKPTQYYFINFQPKNNLIFEPIEFYTKRIVELTNDKKKRSEISPGYARRFIKEFIIDEKGEI